MTKRDLKFNVPVAQIVQPGATPRLRIPIEHTDDKTFILNTLKTALITKSAKCIGEKIWHLDFFSYSADSVSTLYLISRFLIL